MKKSDFPFRAGKESMRMGLESTPIRDWLTVSEEYEERTRLKKQLSEQLGQRVYAQVAYSSDEQIEFAELVKEFFSEIRPECCSLVLKLPAKNFGEYPLNDIAKYLEEDVCLLREMEGEYRLTAASVCNPTWWDLRDKIGRPLSEIHQPIHGLEEKLGRMIAHFLSQLSPKNIFRRMNWFLTPTEELCVFPETYSQAGLFSGLDKSNVGEQLFIRTETQTFRRLPKSNAIAFTIRVAVQPVSILRTDPEAARGLLKTLNNLQDDARKQRRVDDYEPALRHYLLETVRG